MALPDYKLKCDDFMKMLCYFKRQILNNEEGLLSYDYHHRETENYLEIFSRNYIQSYQGAANKIINVFIEGEDCYVHIADLSLLSCDNIVKIFCVSSDKHLDDNLENSDFREITSTIRQGLKLCEEGIIYVKTHLYSEDVFMKRNSFVFCGMLLVRLVEDKQYPCITTFREAVSLELLHRVLDIVSMIKIFPKVEIREEKSHSGLDIVRKHPISYLSNKRKPENVESLEVPGLENEFIYVPRLPKYKTNQSSSLIKRLKAEENYSFYLQQKFAKRENLFLAEIRRLKSEKVKFENHQVMETVKKKENGLDQNQGDACPVISELNQEIDNQSEKGQSMTMKSVPAPTIGFQRLWRPWVSSNTDLPTEIINETTKEEKQAAYALLELLGKNSHVES